MINGQYVQSNYRGRIQISNFLIHVDVHDVIYKSYEAEICNINLLSLKHKEQCIFWFCNYTHLSFMTTLNHVSQAHGSAEREVHGEDEVGRRKWRQRPRRLGRGKRRKQSQTACSVPKIEGDVHNSFCANNSCYNCTSIPWGSEFYPDCCCALQHSRLHLLLVCYCPTFLEARDCLHFRKNGISRCWIGVHTNDSYVSPRLSFMDHPLNLSLFIVDLRLEDIHHLMYRTQVK